MYEQSNLNEFSTVQNKQSVGTRKVQSIYLFFYMTLNKKINIWHYHHYTIPTNAPWHHSVLRQIKKNKSDYDSQQKIPNA